MGTIGFERDKGKVTVLLSFSSVLALQKILCDILEFGFLS